MAGTGNSETEKLCTMFSDVTIIVITPGWLILHALLPTQTTF